MKTEDILKLPEVQERIEALKKDRGFSFSVASSIAIGETGLCEHECIIDVLEGFDFVCRDCSQHFERNEFGDYIPLND